MSRNPMSALRRVLDGAKRWLGLGRAAPASPAAHTTAVDGDRYDDQLWQQTFEAASKLRELADGLTDHDGHAGALLRDLFLALFKASPRLRDPADMDVRYRRNRTVVAAVTDSPEWKALRRVTVGDVYASAMALLGLGDRLTELLEHTQVAREAAEAAHHARQAAEQAGDAVAEAVAAAEAALATVEDTSDGASAAQAPHAQAQEANGAASAAATVVAGVAESADQDKEEAGRVERADGDPQADDSEHPPDDARQLQQTAGELSDAVAAAETATATAETAGKAADDAAEAARGIIQAVMRRGAQAAAAQADADAERLHAWGVDPGELKRMSFAEREQLAERLRGHRLAKFTALLGRFRRMAAGERARRIPEGAEEVAGVGVGSDVTRLVGAELTLLATPATRPLFAARLAAQQLRVHQLRGTQPAGRGPIVVVIDCSGSMRSPMPGGWTREAWAKALALALLDSAHTDRRDFAGILFSAERDGTPLIKTFRFPKGQASIHDVLDLGEFFWAKDTVFQAPLDTAIDILAHTDAGHRRGGDMVFITDGECKVSSRWLTSYRQRKTALGFRCFGVFVSARDEPSETLTALTDSLHRVTDLADVDAARDLIRDV